MAENVGLSASKEMRYNKFIEMMGWFIDWLISV